MPVHIRNHTFWLTTDRCIYWEQQQALLLSDLHFGKTGHFRKSGIAVPQTVFKEDMQRFASLLQYFQPKQAIVIGDMFHSHNNKEHAFFLKWRKDFSFLDIKLVIGNHDILDMNWYADAGIDVFADKLSLNNFYFVHDINTVVNIDEAFCFTGHIHPCINLQVGSKQSLRLPCFYFTAKYAVMPAFGKFTGTYTVKPKKGDSVFAVLPADTNKRERGGILKVY